MFWKICLGIALILTAQPAWCASTEMQESLAAAYPGSFTVSDGGLTWADGEFMPFDDGRADKSVADMLLSPDLEDQWSMPYPAGTRYALPAPGQDPGRIRYTPFFKKMYGATEDEVRSNLVTVHWFPHSSNVPIQVTSVNGVAKRLEAISAELEALPPALRACAERPAGWFEWRPIAGTDRLSPHSFGIAIDLDLAWSVYWRWDLEGPMKKMLYTNRIPMEVVEIFERHGFIWGGKWYHYDTMHFEYRPELLPPVATQAAAQ